MESSVRFVVASKLPRKQFTQRLQVLVFVANGDDTTNSLVNSVRTTNRHLWHALEAFGQEHCRLSIQGKHKAMLITNSGQAQL